MCTLMVNAAGQASAQPAQQDGKTGSEQLPEVLVTAQRMPSAASRTPVSMTVLDGGQLERAALAQPSALGARLPNVHLDGTAQGLRMTIRGVSNADTTEKGDPSAAFMQDGVYIARPQIQNLSFFDLARVEVLRGPQGTLYGRNATAGVVHVISNTPGKAFEGALSAEAGNYASRRVGAMVNVPVSDSLALRAALAYNKHDSYLINGQGTGFKLGKARDDMSARLSARVALGAKASLLLRYDNSTQDSNNDSIVPVTNFYRIGADGAPAYLGPKADAALTNGFRPRNAPLEQGTGRAVTDGLNAELSWDLGAVTLHYLGAHRRFDNDFLNNYYYRLTPAVAIGVRQSFAGAYKQDSHEVRLAGNGGGALNYQAGLYYLHEQAEVRYSFRDLQPLGLTPYYVFPLETDAVARAVFGQATYSITDRLRATAGARYSDDRKARSGSTNFQQAADFNPATDLRLLNAAQLDTNKSTWRLGAEFDTAAGALLFATVSSGYKAGGFNDGCLAGSARDGIACPAALAVPASALLYQPETLTSWEAGLKARFWNGKATLNASAFYYDYKNLQLSGVAVVQGAPRFVTLNAGEASVKGLEVEGQLGVTPAGRLSYSLALLDAQYDNYLPDGRTSWAGRKLDRAPRATFSLGYDHTIRIERARLRAGFVSRYSADYVISVPSQLLQYQVPSRTQSDLHASYLPDGASWSLHAHVKNLEDKVRPIAIDSFGMVVPGDPRNYGARVEYRF